MTVGGLGSQANCGGICGVDMAAQAMNVEADLSDSQFACAF
jgi:hypothetical protein